MAVTSGMGSWNLMNEFSHKTRKKESMQWCIAYFTLPNSKSNPRIHLHEGSGWEGTFTIELTQAVNSISFTWECTILLLLHGYKVKAFSNVDETKHE